MNHSALTVRALIHVGNDGERRRAKKVRLKRFLEQKKKKIGCPILFTFIYIYFSHFGHSSHKYHNSRYLTCHHRQTTAVAHATTFLKLWTMRKSIQQNCTICSTIVGIVNCFRTHKCHPCRSAHFHRWNHFDCTSVLMLPYHKLLR